LWRRNNRLRVNGPIAPWLSADATFPPLDGPRLLRPQGIALPAVGGAVIEAAGARWLPFGGFDRFSHVDDSELQVELHGRCGKTLDGVYRCGFPKAHPAGSEREIAAHTQRSTQPACGPNPTHARNAATSALNRSRSAFNCNRDQNEKNWHVETRVVRIVAPSFAALSTHTFPNPALPWPLSSLERKPLKKTRHPPPPR